MGRAESLAEFMQGFGDFAHGLCTLWGLPQMPQVGQNNGNMGSLQTIELPTSSDEQESISEGGKKSENI